jgi:hypothetical protein
MVDSEEKAHLCAAGPSPSNIDITPSAWLVSASWFYGPFDLEASSPPFFFDFSAFILSLLPQKNNILCLYIRVSASFLF